MAKLFGFSIDDSEKTPDSVVSPVPRSNEDGVDYFVQSGFYGQYVDIEGVYRTEYDLIKRYREMALHPECDGAIEDVVNEGIVSDLYDSPVEIELTNVQASDKLKDRIREEFKHIKEMLDFDKKSHEIFKNWYVDGRLYYIKVIDTKRPQDGIQEIRYVDPMKMKFVRQEKGTKNKGKLPLDPLAGGGLKKDDYPEIDEYYIYTPKPNYPTSMYSTAAGAGGKGQIKIAKDSVCHVTSGLFDRNKGTCLSYLHKAIKALNQLRMIEDSLVIYRLSRAPERRIFYIDVGNLPKVKAEQYLKEVMSRYRNKLVYDAGTGEVRDDRKFMSMMEDFWLPRREGGRGTEISTLGGGQNLGEIEDVEYFKKKMFLALNVPQSRMQPESGFQLGRATEINRDELKFTKFVGRLRKKFNEVFQDLLRTQLILKGIMDEEDWEKIKEDIRYDYVKDNQFSELKDQEILRERLALVRDADEYIGKYYSLTWIRKNILKQNDDEIEAINSQIEAETPEEGEGEEGGF